MAQNNDAKRATTVLTIAQVKFKQALKRDDHEARLMPVSAEASSHFFRDLDAFLRQNTPVNVQKCTEWIVKHIAPSKVRVAVLGDYLVSASKSILLDQKATLPAKKVAARNRLNLLLIVNDVLHTDKYHNRSNAKQGIFGKEIASFTLKLIDLAISFIVEQNGPTEKKLRALLNYWAANGLLGAEDLESLRNRVDEGLLLAQGGTPVRKRTYLLPEYHGDKTAPWHELPASYMLDQMIKRPKRPIDPSRIKIVKFDKKPVSPHVRKLLDQYLENVDLKYLPNHANPTGETNKYRLSLDPLGQLVKRDKETGEQAIVCNGYGWSPKFCRDMQMHGVSDNIKILREDLKRLEEAEGPRDVPQKRHDDRRYSRSPRRRRRQSSSDPDRGADRFQREVSRNHSPGRRGSASSFSSHRSRSRSPDRNYSHVHHSTRDERRGSGDGGQKYEERASRSSWSQPRPLDRDSSQSGPQRNRSDGPIQTSPGYSDGNQFSGPPPPHQSFGQHLPPGMQPSFHVNPFPPPPPPLGQFPGPYPTGQFPSHHPPFPPPQFAGPGGFPSGVVPHAPPPTLSGPNQTPAPGSVGYGNRGGYNQSSANFSGTRGGYGGNFQRGGYNSNRGGYGGHQRGQRGGRY